MTYSANTDSELATWLRRAFESREVPIFVRTIVGAEELSLTGDDLTPVH